MPAISSRIPVTVAALSPLALPDLPDEIGHRLAAYLFDKHRFWTEVPAPSVALDEPSFSLQEHFDGLRRSALALELLDPVNAGAGVPARV